jgi:tRNA (guanine37-N1)-methyltransferase
MQKEKKRQSLKDVLKRDSRFSAEELRFLPRSFDVLGSIALIQIPFNLENKAKIIARKLLELNKNIKAVYGKGKFYGRLRKPKLRWLAGKKIEETFYKESGCLFKLNVKTCFFSPRLATDRLDIAGRCKKKDKVLVMFSGIAPYGIVIAKHAKCKVTCVELSKECTKYAKENIKLNKLHNCETIQGDVKKINKLVDEKFDKIIMARPQLKYDFLKEAFSVSKKGTIIFFQDFLMKQELDKGVHIKRINVVAKKAKKKVKILGTRILRELAPYKYNIRVDFKVL